MEQIEVYKDVKKSNIDIDEYVKSLQLFFKKKTDCFVLNIDEKVVSKSSIIIPLTVFDEEFDINNVHNIIKQKRDISLQHIDGTFYIQANFTNKMNYSIWIYTFNIVVNLIVLIKLTFFS